MELRTDGDRAVLVGHHGHEEREIDPDELALPGELRSALHEWARVVAAVHRVGPGTERDPTSSVVSHRGKQLAGRIAATTGTPVSYLDPVTGMVSVIAAERTGRRDEANRPPARPAEPTPWATGLTVSAFVAVVTLSASLALASALGETSYWLSLLANVVLSGGLAPSIWLGRRVLVWRWVALGAAAGLALGWLALPFIVFGG